MTYKKFIIKNNSSIKKTLKQMSIIGEKCLIVENEMNKFLGTISDGDLRKAILKNYNIKVSINKIYNQKPIILQKNYLINDAKKKFLKYKLDIIPVLYKNKLVQVLTWNEFFSEKKKI